MFAPIQDFYENVLITPCIQRRIYQLFSISVYNCAIYSTENNLLHTNFLKNKIISIFDCLNKVKFFVPIWDHVKLVYEAFCSTIHMHLEERCLLKIDKISGVRYFATWKY